ncbi:MAG: hypothetical protein WA797_08710, partial [Acidimicrobiales bacterium]
MSSLSPRAMGRLAGILLVGSAVGWPVVLLLPLHIEGLHRPIVLASCAMGLCLGVFALLAPWNRWPRSASLLLAVAAFLLVTTANTFSATIPQGFGAMFTTIFAWMGIAHPRGTPTKFAIPVGLLFFIAILHQPGPMGGLDLAPATAIVVPTGVLVGEVLAWMGQRLRDAQLLDRERLAGIRRLVAVSELLAEPHESRLLPTRIARMAIPSLGVTGSLITFVEADGSLTGAGGCEWPIPPEDVRIESWNVPVLRDLMRCEANVAGALPIVTDIEELGVQSALAVPLVTSGGTVGVLFLVTEDPDDPFLQDLAHTYAT